MRATALVKDFRIDFELVHSIQGRTITLGDIAGHAVPVNAFGQIVDHFTALLDLDLSDRIAKAVDRWETEMLGKPPAPIIPDYKIMATHLARLFEVRHILCHELPREPVYGREEVSIFLSHAEEFAAGS